MLWQQQNHVVVTLLWFCHQNVWFIENKLRKQQFKSIALLLVSKVIILLLKYDNSFCHYFVMKTLMTWPYFLVNTFKTSRLKLLTTASRIPHYRVKLPHWCIQCYCWEFLIQTLYPIWHWGRYCSDIILSAYIQTAYSSHLRQLKSIFVDGCVQSCLVLSAKFS